LCVLHIIIFQGLELQYVALNSTCFYLLITTFVNVVKRAGRHAISLTADGAIAEYKGKFAELLDAFNRQAILETEIATFGVAKGVGELG
jgi:hypothetical protein